MAWARASISWATALSEAALQGALVGIAGGIGRNEQQAFHVADKLAFDMDGAVLLDGRRQVFPLLHALHQHAGAPIDEALRQTSRARRPTACPRSGALRPCQWTGSASQRAVGHEGPGADMRNAVGDGVDIAVEAVADTTAAWRTSRWGSSRRRNAGTGICGRRCRHARRWRCCGSPGSGRHPTTVRHRAAVAAKSAISGSSLTCSSASTSAALRARANARCGGSSLSERLERFDRSERKFPVAPLQDADRLEIVVLEAPHRFIVERFGLAGHAERAVVEVAAGPAGHLAELSCVQDRETRSRRISASRRKRRDRHPC